MGWSFKWKIPQRTNSLIIVSKYTYYIHTCNSHMFKFNIWSWQKVLMVKIIMMMMVSVLVDERRFFYKGEE